MAGHGYMNRGYTGYTDDWRRKKYGENGYPDQVNRPVVFDSEGRKRPVISYSPNLGSENYITRSTDRIFEYGCPPMEPVKDCTCSIVSACSCPHPCPCWIGVGEYTTNIQVEANRATRPSQYYYLNKERDKKRSGRKVWSTPASHDTPLSGPTNDIGKAVEILEEAAMTSPALLPLQ